MKDNDIELDVTLPWPMPGNAEHAASCLWSILPYDALDHIFDRLSYGDWIRCERVCSCLLTCAREMWTRRSRLRLGKDFGVLQNWGIWGNVSCQSSSKGKRGFDDLCLKSVLLRTHGCLRSLEIDLPLNIDQLTAFAIRLVAQYCPQLEALSWLQLGSIPVQIMKIATESLNQLRVIRLSSNIDCEIKKDAFFALVRANQRTLEEIDVKGCSNLRGKFCQLLGSKLNTLRITSGVLEKGFTAICDQCTGLKRLEIVGHANIRNLNFRDIHEMEPSMDRVVAAFSQLRELVVHAHNYRWIDERNFYNALLPHLHHLQILELPRSNLDDTGLKCLAKACAENASLELDGSSLRVLNLDKCWRLSRDALKEALPKFTALQVLRLGYCEEVHDFDLPNSTTWLPSKLKELHLMAAANLQPKDVSTAVLHLHQLRLLNLSGCLQLQNLKKEFIELAGALANFQSQHRQIDIYLGQIAGVHKLKLEPYQSLLAARGLKIHQDCLGDLNISDFPDKLRLQIEIFNPDDSDDGEFFDEYNDYDAFDSDANNSDDDYDTGTGDDCDLSVEQELEMFSEMRGLYVHDEIFDDPVDAYAGNRLDQDPDFDTLDSDDWDAD